MLADSAAVGKLQSGDRILAVDGKPLTSGYPPSLSDLVDAGAGAPVTLLIRRGDAPLEVTIQPRPNDGPGARGPGRPGWLLGISRGQDMERTTDLVAAANFAILTPGILAGSVVTGYVESLFGSEDSDPGGPVRIVEEFRGKMASFFTWVRALRAAAHALVVLALLDLVRVAALLLGRARCRPAA